MKSVQKLAVAALIASGLFASDASADVYRAIFTGVSPGFDDLYGDFGPAGAVYPSGDFTAVFTVDDTGFAQSYGPENGDFGQMQENYLAFAPSYNSKITATLTLNGTTIDIITPGDLGGGSILQEHNYPDCDTCSVRDRIDYDIYDLTAGRTLEFSISTPNRGASFLSSSITHTYGTYDVSGAPGQFGAFDSGNGLYATTVTVAPFVPEPAAWSLMILGFGGIGVALRRRARAARA